MIYVWWLKFIIFFRILIMLKIWVFCLVGIHHYYLFLVDWKSLSSFHDISKRNTNNVKDMNTILCNCSSFSSLPEISNWILIKLLVWVLCFVNVNHYHLCLIFQNGILMMSMTWVLCFIIVHHYRYYLIFQNGILIKLLVWFCCFNYVH